MSENLIKLASNFTTGCEIESVVPFRGGHIHQSYFVKTKGKDSDVFLLQHKNQVVFRNVPGMMANISLITRHIKSKLAKMDIDPDRHTLTLIPAQDGSLCFRDESGEFWAMYLFIKDSVTYHKPKNGGQAYSGGMVTGEFHGMLADFSDPLTDILPGFHNLKFRYKQWDEVIGRLSSSHRNTFGKEIAWIESRREDMIKFRMFFEQGQIPIRIAHNDAKLSNVLFDREGKALCLIDLDTVQYGSVLYDFGDAIRSYANSGEEDEKDEEKVQLRFDIFESFTEGYLKRASEFLTETEVNNLANGTRYICFEQVLRFLMDYLDGNKYYRIEYPEHNLIRARAQYKLLLEVERSIEKMKDRVLFIYKQYKV